MGARGGMKLPPIFIRACAVMLSNENDPPGPASCTRCTLTIIDTFFATEMSFLGSRHSPNDDTLGIEGIVFGFV